jgi:sulfate adenylyltransferase subunit 1
LDARLDIDSLAEEEHPRALTVNEIGRVTLRAAAPLPLDPYIDNRRTGSFLLIDESDGSTLTAGMVGDPLTAVSPAQGAASAASTEA